MGTCVRCKGEYDNTSKRCARCGADNTRYAEQEEQGFGTWLNSKPIKTQLVLLLTGLLPFAILYSARFKFWEREYLRDLDFLTKRPRSINHLTFGVLLGMVILALVCSSGVLIVSHVVLANVPDLGYTILFVILAFLFWAAVSTCCALLTMSMEVKRLKALLPRPIFMDGPALQDLVVKEVYESLKLKSGDGKLDIIEMKRADSAGIGLIVVWITKEFDIDERGERKEKTKAQRFQVKADKWGRISAIEEKKD